MINFYAARRKNMTDGTIKYYPHIAPTQPVNRSEIIRAIEKVTSLSSSDIKSCLDALEYQIVEHLRQGHSVRLGDLGTLQIGISSKGALTEEDYNDSLITKAHINFRPGSALVGILTNLTFAKVKVRSSKADKEAEEGEPEGGV